MRPRKALDLLLIATIGAAATPARADDVERFGRLATLAPLCTVRSETWSFDLRRAELQSATGSARFDDAALEAAPGSRQVVAALSSAEHTALEEFAENSPSRSCEAVRADPDLHRADEVVRAFRAQREHPSGS